MFAPLTLCLASVIGLALAAALPGWQNWVMLAGPMLLASAWLLLRAGLARGATDRGLEAYSIHRKCLNLPDRPGGGCLRASSHRQNMS